MGRQQLKRPGETDSTRHTGGCFTAPPSAVGINPRCMSHLRLMLINDVTVGDKVEVETRTIDVPAASLPVHSVYDVSWPQGMFFLRNLNNKESWWLKAAEHKEEREGVCES